MRILFKLLLPLLIVCSLSVSAQAPVYHEPYRPQVHFSPAKNWTNDPNGLVYFDGEYHLFFQYNPFGDQWGHMSWGHAVSTDMLHWQELRVAIPEQGDEMVFTGSVVVDEKNTSGFCTGGKPCMVAVYTGHHTKQEGANKTIRQNQNLAYSNDRGRTWTRFSGNPVLDRHMADFRDPSVFRDEAHKRWVMAVALPREHKVEFYGSPDLKQWTLLSAFGPAGAINGEWECPDLVRVPHERSESAMWALKVGINPGAPQGGSGEQYFLGSFDGTRFTPSSAEGAHGWTNYGKDDYCAISFNYLPKSEPRPILLGWMNNWQYAGKLPTSPWRGLMSLPRRLSYLRDADGLGLKQAPVTEALRGEHVAVDAGKEMTLTAPFELSLRFDENAKGPTGVRLYTDKTHYTEIAFDGAKGEFSMDRTHAGAEVAPNFPARTVALLSKARGRDLRLVVDTISVEAYAQQGTIAMTNLVFPSSVKNRVVFFGGGAVAGDGWELKSVWK